MRAHEHQHYRTEAWPEIVDSYRTLARRFDLIIIEGAGGTHARRSALLLSPVWQQSFSLRVISSHKFSHFVGTILALFQR
jgi:hypothetical protein